MQEKKLDINSIIGFVLIFGILLFWMYQNQPTPEELEVEKAQDAKIVEPATINLQDSTDLAQYKGKIGAFGFTAAREGTTKLENDVLFLEISNKGGQIVEARMKQFKTYDSVPVYLVKDGNASFALNFTTADNRVLNTQDLYFEPSQSKNGIKFFL